jgi:hypothetical protein
MSQKNVKDIRKQLRNVVQEQMSDVLTNELIAKAMEEVEAKLRAVFGARLEAINDSILSQLRSMDDRAKDLQQFILNQATAEIAASAPKVELDQNTPDSATLVQSE